MDIVEFCRDPNLLNLSLSPAQETLLRATYGLELTDEQFAFWRECTGREDYPGKPFGEVTVVAGARSGKDSRIAAPVAIYEAFLGGHEKQLAKGERGMVPIVAQDLRATKIAFGYVRDYLLSSPVLRNEVADVRALEIELKNRLTVACFPCTVRSLRGWSIPTGILDEVGFWRLEGSVDSDSEVQTSIRRGGLSFPSPRLVKVSTPYLKSGVLYHDFSKHFASSSQDVLVWRAPTALMNPTVTAERLERERRLDPQRFPREYEAVFTDDLESFLPSEWIEKAVVPGRHELPPLDGIRYVAGCDPSGGRADAFTLSICHTEGSRREGQRVVQDFVKGWVRGSLEATVGEIVGILRRYKVSTIWGDRYAGSWVSEAFRRERIAYRNPRSPSGYVDKSAAYVELERLLASGTIELLDNEKLTRELSVLERHNRAGGKPLIDHPRGLHDDLANSLAIAAHQVLHEGRTRPRVKLLFPGTPYGGSQLFGRY